PSSLYKAFPPEEARRILRKLELHYTPKHGSWLNMAEIELNVMTRQCLSRRLGSLEEVATELACWEKERKQLQATIKWQFTTKDARVKLRSLYPIVRTEAGYASIKT
ncbi:MAG: transposase, partial [Mesotoga sp.]